MKLLLSLENGLAEVKQGFREEITSGSENTRRRWRNSAGDSRSPQGLSGQWPSVDEIRSGRRSNRGTLPDTSVSRCNSDSCVDSLGSRDTRWVREASGDWVHGPSTLRNSSRCDNWLSSEACSYGPWISWSPVTSNSAGWPVIFTVRSAGTPGVGTFHSADGGRDGNQ